MATTSKKATQGKSTAKAGKTAKSSKTSTSRAKSTRTNKKTKNSNAQNMMNEAAEMFEPIAKRVKSTSWLAVLESLIVGALGLILVIEPQGMTKIIFYVLGIFLMVKGVYKILNYFAMHGKYDFYNNDLLYGIVALIFGILSVVMWQQLSSVIGIIVGAWMIYSALVRMNTAIKMHAAGVKEWFYVLLLSLVMLALGIYLVVSFTAVVMVIGWIMVAAAVVGIVDDLVLIQHIDEIMK